jgi:choline dehydrogenase
MAATFDYVIVGAGTTGCVLAGRLAESGRYSVCVIEAGPMDNSIWIKVPLGFFKSLQDSRINWNYQACYDETGDTRVMNWPRGKVVGGSGSINGLVYVRGQRQDYEDWNAVAGQGWGWQDVGRCFERAETLPLISTPRWCHPLCDAFIRSAGEAGIGKCTNFNGVSQEGAAYFSLNTSGGWRASTAKLYLHPNRRAGRLELVTDALVEKVEIGGGRARGVRYRQGDTRHHVEARREVIICAGAIATPQLLQLSGLGPARVLRQAGVEVVQDIPGIGRNLGDHFAVRVMAKIKDARTLNEMSHSLFSRAWMAAQFAVSRTGPLTIGAGMAGLFTNVLEPDGRPDIQLLMGPLSTENAAEGLHRFPGMTITYSQLRPESTGSVEIVSAKADDHPRIVANYLAAEADRAVVLEGMRLTRRILSAPTLSKHVEVEYLPGPDCRSDDEVLEYAKQYGGTVYHPCGTVTMGASNSAPLDWQLKLRGIDGLRVADASIMPIVVSGNTNAACIMIGERAAEMVLADGAS